MKRKNKKKRTREMEAIAKGWEINDFVESFKVGFLQLICKASLIFQSNLGLALSIILKETELHESKNVAVECRCLKIWDLLSLFICSSILVLKWRQVSPIWLELQLARVNLYTRKDFKSSGIASLYEKTFLILNEVKTS